MKKKLVFNRTKIDTFAEFAAMFFGDKAGVEECVLSNNFWSDDFNRLLTKSELSEIWNLPVILRDVYYEEEYWLFEIVCSVGDYIIVCNHPNVELNIDLYY